VFKVRAYRVKFCSSLVVLQFQVNRNLSLLTAFDSISRSSLSTPSSSSIEQPPVVLLSRSCSRKKSQPVCSDRLDRIPFVYTTLNYQPSKTKIISFHNQGLVVLFFASRVDRRKGQHTRIYPSIYVVCKEPLGCANDGLDGSVVLCLYKYY